MITHARLREVLEYDSETGLFRWLKQLAPRGKVGSVAGGAYNCIDGKGSIRKRWSIRIDGTLYLAHRLAWFYVNGEWPGPLLDHVDGNPLNNAFLNLRPASKSQNLYNTRIRRDNRSGVKGVHWDSARGKWMAVIKADRRSIHLGRFDKLEDASAARAIAEEKYHGDYRRVA